MQFIPILAMVSNICIFVVGSCAEVKFKDFTFTAGPVSIKPKVGLNFNYDDNVFDFSVPVADFISRCSAGIEIKGKLSKVDLLLSPGVQYVFFARNSSLNYDDKRFLTSASVFLHNMSMEYKYEYNENTHPTTYTESFVKESYKNNGILLRYKFYYFALGAAYNTSLTERGTFWESNKAEVYALLLYLGMLYEKNIVLSVESGRNEWSVSYGRNCNIKKFLFSMDGKITYKISGNVKFGYTMYDYKEIKDWSGFVLLCSLVWDLIEGDKIMLSLRHSIYESFYSRENYYITKNIRCDLCKTLGTRFLVKPYVELAVDDYPVPPYPKRVDNIIKSGFEASLKVKLFRSIGVRYSIISRSSTIKEYNFVTSSVSFFLSSLF